MMVIDASVTLAWCFDDESSDLADDVLARLEKTEGLVPSIWPLEVANGLRTAERRGRLTRSEIPRLGRLLGALPVRIERIELVPALGEVLDLARAHDLTAYDAAYLDVALRFGLPMGTVDLRLARACVSAGVALVATA
jgi:predicted nucleic acid-binding protein